MKLPWQKRTITAETVNAAIAQLAYSCKVYSISETGPTRSSNEDSIISFFPGYNQHTVFAMVADGMGGHNAGEVASKMACDVAKNFIAAHYPQANAKAMMEEMIQEMHTHIRRAADRETGLQGMGTTATALFIRGGNLYYSHVGDSRLYRYADHEMIQLTRDHTLVNEMIKDGKLTPEQAEHHDMKHVLMQALGTVDKIEPEVSDKNSFVRKGEYYILCSDGIHDALPEAEMKSLLSMQQPALAVEAIKAICYQRKARDNFSLIIVEITEGQPVESNGATREQNIME
ncbi:MAG: serine/threonine-protein phosphatase [Bacteroidetes bacterium]|nr:serine/threonine-protein phosphatase [Bacteroidota bacterium]